MKSFLLGLVHVVCALILVAAACSDSGKSSLVKGKWHTPDNSTKLEINGKQFIMDEGTPIAEDYFMKGDTIYTSFEGNQPYTRFVIQQLDDHNLKLLYPDSVSVAFTK